MGILKKYNEFLSPESFVGDMGSEQHETELHDALKKLSEEGGEAMINGYKISLPSELNYEGKPKTYLIDKGGKHAQAQSEEEVERVVTEQVLFESFRTQSRKRK
jgi:hypothetical protein